MKGGGDDLALFGDPSEVGIEDPDHVNEDGCHLKAFQNGTTFFNNLEASPPTPPPHEGNVALMFDSPFTPVKEASIYLTDDERSNDSWKPGDDIDISLTKTFRCVSLDTVVDFTPDKARAHQLESTTNRGDYDFPIEDDDGPQWKRTVRFADTHTYLCTPPPPPTPPPHRSLSSAPSESIPYLLLRDYSYISLSQQLESHAFHGPRAPPWGSSENLERERRLRTDIRFLEDKLEHRFDEDYRRRARERARIDQELKKGIRKTDGDELRELVLGIYPDMGFESKERTRCCACVVM